MVLCPPLGPLLISCLAWPIVAIGGAYGVLLTFPSEFERQTMSRVTKGLRADVQDLDVEAGGNRWTPAGSDGLDPNLEGSSSASSREVMTLTPYAEAAVTVGISKGEREQRWCSLCLN